MANRKYLTEEEFTRFMAAVRTEPNPSNRLRIAAFTVMYWRGLRASEIGKLLWSSWHQAAGALYVVRGKGSVSSEYPLSPAENRALKAQARERGAASGALFPSRSGGKGISLFMLHLLFGKYAAIANLPEDLRHCHVLKHSIGTHLIGKLDVKAVQDWLGHKDIKATMVYTQFRSKDRDSAARQIYGESRVIYAGYRSRERCSTPALD